MSMPRLPIPRRGVDITVRCIKCGHTGYDEEPFCDHESSWVFVSPGMRDWAPYVRRERWALRKASS